MELFVEWLISVVAAIIIGLIVSYPAMLLWNSCLVPAINGINQVDWIQAWGIMILVGLFTSKARA